MRLSDRDVGSLVSCAQALFAGPWQLELFGSRVDDALRGGDIDLLLTFDSEEAFQAALRLKFAYLVRVKGQLGEQKVDAVLTTRERSSGDAFIQSLGDRRIQLGSWPQPPLRGPRVS